MGRFRSIAMLFSLPVAGTLAYGAGFDDPPAAAGPSPAAADSAPNSAEPPAPPRKYLEAGAQLFNKQKYDVAGRYLRAANLFRDRLTDSERVVLDVYRERLAAVVAAPREPAVAPPVTTDPGVITTSVPAVDPVQALTQPRPGYDAIADPGMTANPSVIPATRDAGSPPPPSEGSLTYGTAAWRDTTDTKQKARWLLQVAREQVFKGHFDLAEQAIAEASALKIQWSVFDETPEKMTEALEKARVKAAVDGTSDSLATGRPVATAESLRVDPSSVTVSRSGGLVTPRDRKTARARLKEARAALAAGDIEMAESVAREVRSWNLRFSYFDDTPEKLAATIAGFRRREPTRDSELTVKSYFRNAPTGPGGAANPRPEVMPDLAPDR